MGASWADQKTTKKMSFLKCCLLLCTQQNKPFLGLWHVTKSGFYMTTGDDQLSGWTEKLQSTSQSQTCMKKRSWSLFGGLRPVWSWWNHYIWEVCSANWCDALKTAMPASGIGQQNRPNSSPWQCPTAHCITNAGKVERTRLRSFASWAIFI